MTLPIKTRILEAAIEINRPFTTAEMQEVLKKDYAGEKTTSFKEVDKQLEMFCRVDMMKAVNADVDAQNNLLVTYEITKAGKEAIKYIPGHGNKLF